MLTATVVFDLNGAKSGQMRNRVAALPDVPSGARVILRVGALAPEPDVVRVVALHERRLQIDVQGTPHAVRRWLDALRTNLGEVLV